MDRFDLGEHERDISTTSADVQQWFNFGLNWCYGFNHEEGLACFHRALEHDPECVMAHWGIAYGTGPFYNNVWREFSQAEADSATKVEYAGAFNFYTSARCHDLHLMMYPCMYLGQFKPAMAAAEQMCATLTKEVLSIKGHPQMAITMEGYFSMKMHVLVRFGRWQEIVDTPMPDDPVLYCVSTAMHHYAKGVANAALKNIDAAVEERSRFYAAVKRIPANRKFFNNTARSTLSVGEMMLNGELEYHKGNYDLAFEHLRTSVRRDDNLEYNEPLAWMHPPRHALAALLAEHGHFAEAEDIYRTDLGLNDKLQRCAQHPRNVWALHGLVECLRQRGETAELEVYEAQLNFALSKTDVAVTSSCMCRSETTAPTCCGS